MKRKLILTICLAISASILTSVSAQNLPPFGGGTWAGDTIIFRGPIIGIGGNGSNAPSRIPTISAIRHQGFLVVNVEPEAPFALSIQNIEGTALVREEYTHQPSTPVIINLTSLPAGIYTLLLYINNECLEGEFEKEY